MVKLLYKNNFIAVYERDGYVFAHEVRTAGRTVALLPFRDAAGQREYLARVEVGPAHSMEPGLYCITGGINLDETILRGAQRELYEETGYNANQDELISLGQVLSSKQMDTVVYLFAVDVDGKPEQEPQGDGTRWEADATVEWVDAKAAVQNQDPLFLSALVRFQGLKLK